MKIAIITGPRFMSNEDETLVRTVVHETISRGFKIYTGDAAGVDHVAYEASWKTRSCHTFCVERKLFKKNAAAALAARSTRMIKEALRDTAGDELIAIGFPNKPCPPGIYPAKTWKSGGSGTWSTLALCAGNRIYTDIFPIGRFPHIANDKYEDFGYFAAIPGDNFLGKFYGHHWHPYETNFFEEAQHA